MDLDEKTGTGVEGKQKYVGGANPFIAHDKIWEDENVEAEETKWQEEQEKDVGSEWKFPQSGSD